jgi:hypothetical protein
MADKPQNVASDLRTAAFALLARGWSVIPVEVRSASMITKRKSLHIFDDRTRPGFVIGSANAK